MIMKPGPLMLSVVVALSLLGCNTQERGKTVRLDKGGYKGPADTEITPATRDVLARRVSLQGFGGGLQQPLSPATPPAPSVKIEGREAAQRF